jgi:hypothetical protein
VPPTVLARADKVIETYVAAPAQVSYWHEAGQGLCGVISAAGES